jgi:tRNA pseudouridine55 synthase
MDGLLIIDKPEGLTSAQAVAAIKRRLRCKTGHLGTLDPFASGVLPLCLGQGTKIAQFLNSADKAYTGIIRLGAATDTGDLTGTVVARADVSVVTPAQLEDAARRFRGDSLQVPPMYSALKRSGMPLYKLARRGVEVERAARPVHVHSLCLTLAAPDRIEFALSCSKGFYVRVLAEEIAVTLGSVGHLERLRRVRFGPYGLDEACPIDATPERLRVLSVREALPHLREIAIPPPLALRARQGYEPILDSFPPGRAGEAVKLVDARGDVSAIIVMQSSGRWRFARVFVDRACE